MIQSDALIETAKETRHSRHANDLESENESCESMTSEEESLKEIDEKPPKKKQKKIVDDSVLLDEFHDYLVMQKYLSTGTCRKHLNNMHTISKRKSYFNITSLLDIPKKFETILKHELIESNHKTSIEYFNSFLAYKFPEVYSSPVQTSQISHAQSSQAQTSQAQSSQIQSSILSPSISITVNNVPYKEGMTISLLTKY